MEANYFIILWWFLPSIDMNQPQVYMCPPSRTPLAPPSPPHPSGSSQCTGFECPVSCVELGLVIYFTYGSIHISLLRNEKFLYLRKGGVVSASRAPIYSIICNWLSDVFLQIVVVFFFIRANFLIFELFDSFRIRLSFLIFKF